MQNKTIQFGEHLIFDGYGCSKEKLESRDFCVSVLNKLVEMAGMHKLHEPYSLQVEGNQVLNGKDPGGISAFVMIQESHISLHTFAKRGFITLDLYSCQTFSSEGIVEYLKSTFECKEESVLKFERGLKYPADNIYD